MPSVLTAQQFDALLLQFAPDRDTAGVKYVELRSRLVTVFRYRGCANPEELADEAMDRVARKLLEAPPADADPRALLFGVAWNVRARVISPGAGGGLARRLGSCRTRMDRFMLMTDRSAARSASSAVLVD